MRRLVLMLLLGGCSALPLPSPDAPDADGAADAIRSATDGSTPADTLPACTYVAVFERCDGGTSAVNCPGAAPSQFCCRVCP